MSPTSAAGPSTFDWGWQEPARTPLETIEHHYSGAWRPQHGEAVTRRLITVYRTRIAPKQGPRCPCLPSCSVFTQYAIEEYGPLVGFIMGIERMYLRENADLAHRLHYVAVTTREGVDKVYDPPEANQIFLDYDWRVLDPRYDLLRIQFRHRSGHPGKCSDVSDPGGQPLRERG